MPQLSLTKSNLYYAGLFTAAAAVTAALFSGIWIPLALVVAAAAIVVCFHFLVSTTQRNNLQVLLVFWAVACPLGYSLVQFPRTSTIITLDRLAAVGALIGLLAASLRGDLHFPAALRRPALVWIAFVAAVVYSLRGVGGGELIGDLRMLIEVFVLPGVLALYIILCFNVRRQISHLHIAICVVTIYLALLGIAELRAGTDLLPTAVDRNEYFGGTGSMILFRANGPYGTNGTYATVGLINLLFLEFLRRTMGEEIKGWRRAMHFLGMACACIVALLPMFRALILTSVVVAAVALFRKLRTKAIVPILLTIASVVVIALLLKTVTPDLFEERVKDPSNLNARLAEYKQGFAVFSDHPFFGVGLNQFYSSVADRYKYLFYFRGESSLDYPHSLPLSLLAETGAVGLTLFVASQLTMLIGFRKLLTPGRSAVGSSTWEFVLLMFLTYCGMNVDLVSGYYDELNTWYMFILAVVVKYGLEQAKQRSSRQVQSYSDRDPVHAI